MKPIIPIITFLAACAGCASTPVPDARVASTESAVQSARAAGADRVPEANQHLRMADDELGKARGFIQNGDNDKATAMLRRAESDANLAAALSRETKQKMMTAAAMQQLVQQTSAGSTR